MQTLGHLVDGDTLAELVAIMAEPDEAAVLLAMDACRAASNSRCLVIFARCDARCGTIPVATHFPATGGASKSP